MRAIPALGFAVAFGVVYLIAFHTRRGLHDDLVVFRAVSGLELVRVRAAGGRALDAIDVGSVLAGIAVVAGIALTRRMVERAVVAAAVVVASLVTVELLKVVLPHPGERGPTFPSGHAAVAASLGLALLLVVPGAIRPLAALVGAAYATGIGMAVVVLGWHYPSDVVGAFFVCGFWASIGALLVRARVGLSSRGTVAAVAAATIAVALAAVVASGHPAAAAALRSREAVVATAVGLAVAALATFAVVAPLAAERR